MLLRPLFQLLLLLLLISVLFCSFQCSHYDRFIHTYNNLNWVFLFSIHLYAHSPPTLPPSVSVRSAFISMLFSFFHFLSSIRRVVVFVAVLCPVQWLCYACYGFRIQFFCCLCDSAFLSSSVIIFFITLESEHFSFSLSYAILAFFLFVHAISYAYTQYTHTASTWDRNVTSSCWLENSNERLKWTHTHNRCVRTVGWLDGWVAHRRSPI